MPNKFDRLFNPRGIAVVGASQDASRHGGQLLLSLAKYGYTGRVHPVNPRYTAIGDYRCYPSVKDINGPCDLAVITLPPSATLQAVHDCAARGVVATLRMRCINPDRERQCAGSAVNVIAGYHHKYLFLLSYFVIEVRVIRARWAATLRLAL